MPRKSRARILETNIFPKYDPATINTVKGKSRMTSFIVRTDVPPHTMAFVTCVPAAASASVPMKASFTKP